MDILMKLRHKMVVRLLHHPMNLIIVLIMYVQIREMVLEHILHYVIFSKRVLELDMAGPDIF